MWWLLNAELQLKSNLNRTTQLWEFGTRMLQPMSKPRDLPRRICPPGGPFHHLIGEGRVWVEGAVWVFFAIEKCRLLKSLSTRVSEKMTKLVYGQFLIAVQIYKLTSQALHLGIPLKLELDSINCGFYLLQNLNVARVNWHAIGDISC